MTVRVYASTDAGAPALSNNAGSLIAVLDACLVPAGWTKVFSSSTIGATYRQGTGSNGFYLNVLDNQPNYVRLRGYETASAFDTGTGPFPLEAQLAGGGYFTKTDNNANNQPWLCFATQKAVYFFSAWNAQTDNGRATWFFFGDIVPEKTGDAYHTVLIAQNTPNQTSNFPDAGSTSYVPYFSPTNIVLPGHFVARSYTQVGGSTSIGKHFNFARAGQGIGYNLQSYSITPCSIGQGLTYPAPQNGGLYVGRCWIHEMNVVRGAMPGLRVGATNPALIHKDTYSGTGATAGKTFMAVNFFYGQFHMETSDTW